LRNWDTVLGMTVCSVCVRWVLGLHWYRIVAPLVAALLRPLVILTYRGRLLLCLLDVAVLGVWLLAQIVHYLTLGGTPKLFQ
jgi:hypothetical protein